VSDPIVIEIPVRARRGPMSDVDDVVEWKEKVLERDSSKCVNCDRHKRVAVCFIVPPEAGGNLRVSNGVVVCRDCRIASESARVLPARIENKAPINFFVSRRLHTHVDSFVHNGSKFGSVSALVRRMIYSFITEPDLYEDLKQWQDRGSEVRINGWVDGTQYGVFKEICSGLGMSYTDALKGLLLVAVEGYEPTSAEH
jgi:hypothetical protein